VGVYIEEYYTPNVKHKLEEGFMNKKNIDLANLTPRQLDDIKSMAVAEYVNGHISHRSPDTYNIHCVTVAFVNFLSQHGYEIKKKEGQDGK
jgi:hypothetical protein